MYNFQHLDAKVGCPYWYTGMKIPLDMPLTSKSPKNFCSVFLKIVVPIFHDYSNR